MCLPADIIGAVAVYSDVFTLARLSHVCRVWRESLAPGRLAVVRGCDMRFPTTAAPRPPAATDVVIDMRAMREEEHAPYLLYVILDTLLRNQRRGTGGLTPTTLVLRWHNRVQLHDTTTLLSPLFDHLEDPHCRIGDLRLWNLLQADMLPSDMLRLVDCCRRLPTLYALSLECSTCGKPFDRWVGALIAYAASRLHTLRLWLRITNRVHVSQSLSAAFGGPTPTSTLQQLDLCLHVEGQPYVLPSTVLVSLSSLRRLRLTLAGGGFRPVGAAPEPDNGRRLPRLEFLALTLSKTGVDVDAICALLTHFGAATAGAPMRGLHVCMEDNDLGSSLWPSLSAVLGVWTDRLRTCQVWVAGNRCGAPPARVPLPACTLVHGADMPTRNTNHFALADEEEEDVFMVD